MGQFSKVLQLLIIHTHHHIGPWTADQTKTDIAILVTST